MLLRCLLSAVLLSPAASSNPLEVRDACKACNPPGVSGTNPPAVGSDLQSLYINLLSSVKNIHFKKRWEDEPSIEQRDSGLCCAEGSECVKVDGLNIPMCYDKFTTNYKFSDGSYGSLTTGDYSAADGSKANLIAGNYTKSGGQAGDIYAGNQAAKPNTATLSIPPQWTGSGVGSAIPVTALGSLVVYTTTIPGTTITTPTTLSASTVLAGSSAVTTIPVRTITAPTTIAPVTTVVTSTPNGATAAASSSSKGAADKVTIGSNASFGMSIFSVLMYFIYAL